MTVKIDSYRFKKRRTFAIISHPDAGKTTLTENFLLNGKIIRVPGTIKSRGSGKYAKSDWMKIEKKRGISITTSIIQIEYGKYLINLLDTPGHKDFSEDTYRVLTAVDFCIIVIDASKGIEEQTRKLIRISRMRSIPILIFINKLDRNSRNPIELLDQLEFELKVKCTPIVWPIGCGTSFKGIYHIYTDTVFFCLNKNFLSMYGLDCHSLKMKNINSSVLLNNILGLDIVRELREDLELINSVYVCFNVSLFLKSDLVPVYFGSALKNFGIDFLLKGILNWAPSPTCKKSNIRYVHSNEKNFSGFIFKIQANMDLKHRDRIAFLRIVSGQYKKNMKLYHVRIKKYILISDVFSFIAGDRFILDEAYPGDIIGFHSHKNIKIGDTFTEGEVLKFYDNISNFSPELFRRISLKNSLHKKKLLKGLLQLSEEGTIQVFKLLENNDFILGAIGKLQFDIVVERLRVEYNICVIIYSVQIFLVRWISSKSLEKLSCFKAENKFYLALDICDRLVYLASSKINLKLVQSRYPDIIFSDICDISY